MIKLSAVILTKNEEKNIVNCLGGLSFCDEILVIDDYSSDSTVSIVKSFKSEKINIISHSLNNDFSQSRDYALKNAKGEWILFVDADEQVMPSLAFEISNVISKSTYSGFYIHRIDVMWGKKLKYGESGSVKLLRLAKKESGKWEGKVHEKWKVEGKIGVLQNPILHYPHQNITEFLREINYYTDIRADELCKSNIKTNMLLIIIYPLGKFFLNYFIRQGYRDGIQGFIYAVFMSLHSFLVRGKLWQFNRRG